MCSNSKKRTFGLNLEEQKTISQKVIEVFSNIRVISKSNVNATTVNRLYFEKKVWTFFKTVSLYLEPHCKTFMNIFITSTI